MKILAFETSTEQASVALSTERGCLSRALPLGAPASVHILQVVSSLVQDAGLSLSDLDGIAYGAGPGAFTGLRTACSVAQGLAYTLGIPVLPVSSLAAMAWTACSESAAAPKDKGKICAVLDARMGQLYVAEYEFSSFLDPAQQAQLFATKAQLVDLDSFQAVVLKTDTAALKGEGGGRLVSNHTGLTPELVYPTALGILSIALLPSASAHWLSAEQAQPDYVRNQVALTTAEREAQKLHS